MMAPDGARVALKNALELAKKLKAQLVAIWVGGFRPYYHETVAEIDEENKSIENFSAKIKNELKSIAKS